MSFWRGLFRGRRTSSQPDLGLPSVADLEEGEGGLHPFDAEMSAMAWISQQKAVEAARSDLDPFIWPSGEMEFPVEFSWAFAHEALRDKLGAKVEADLRDLSRELHSQASEIASQRLELSELDVQLVEEMEHRDELMKRASASPEDLSTYYRRRNLSSSLLKYGFAALLVLSEVAMTTEVFGALEASNAGGAFVVALGAILIFILIPHQIAIGWKAGSHQRTLAELEWHREKGEVPPDLKSRSDQEVKSDFVLRVTTILMTALLLGMLVPLSVLRTEVLAGGDLKWLGVFMLLQLIISVFFFYIAWRDHSHLSDELLEVSRRVEQTAKTRSGLIDEMLEALAVYRDEGLNVEMVVAAAPRWDSEIVLRFNQTMENFRNDLLTQRPEFAPFFAYATRPLLDTGEAAETATKDADRTFVSIYRANRYLEEESVFGRTWLMRQRAAAMEAEDSPSTVDQLDWVLAKSPEQLLATYLDELGFELEYEPPPELQRLDAESQDDESPADEMRRKGPNGTKGGHRAVVAVGDSEGDEADVAPSGIQGRDSESPADRHDDGSVDGEAPTSSKLNTGRPGEQRSERGVGGGSVGAEAAVSSQTRDQQADETS